MASRGRPHNGHSVDNVYRTGRVYPYGENHAGHPAPKVAANDYHEVAPEDRQAPQHRENQHDKHYDNDVGKQWTRGYGDPYPHFDHSNKAPRFNSSKGDTWPEKNRQPTETYGAGGGKAQLTPERNRPTPVNTNVSKRGE